MALVAKPKSLLFDHSMKALGLELSDGTKVIGGFQWYCNNSVALPQNLRLISMYFRKNEHFMHSMEFHGSEVVTIGMRGESH